MFLEPLVPRPNVDLAPPHALGFLVKCVKQAANVVGVGLRMIFSNSRPLLNFSIDDEMKYVSSVRLTFEQIQLVGRIRENRAGWVELKQLMQRSCLEHGRGRPQAGAPESRH